MPFARGSLHAPYFSFLRCRRYTDAELLSRFGLPGYRLARATTRLSRYAVLGDDGEWTMIADDWFYTLWHMSSTRPEIEVLAGECDVFACSVGDCDRSFDFVYYRDGRLVRKYVVADPHFQGGVVTEDFGDRLPGEAAAFTESDEVRIALGIAASLGIKIDYAVHEARVYAAPRRR
jgi:hypothetical protein